MTGFIPTFEILRAVRAAGLEPLVRPLREGSVYVVRATDFRGRLMRVVLDARTGTLRDVTPIVPPDPDEVGMLPETGMIPGRYGDYGDGRYPPPPVYEYDEPLRLAPAPAIRMPAVVPPRKRPAAAARKALPPLPRPRPPALAGPIAEPTAPSSPSAVPDQRSSMPAIND